MYCQIERQRCNEDEEQITVNWEMKKKKEEQYGLEKCSNANGIKCNSTKVKGHVLEKEGIFCYKLVADQAEMTEWKKDMNILINHRTIVNNQHDVAVGKD